MVDCIGFAGGEAAVVIGWCGIAEGAKESVCILHQQQVDAFFSVLRQAVTGFDGVVQRITKDDAEVFRIKRQAFLNAYLVVEHDALAFGKGFFCAENGIQRVVASVDTWANVLQLIGEPCHILLPAGNIGVVQVTFNGNQLIGHVMLHTPQFILFQYNFIHMLELRFHLLLKLLLFADDLILLSHMLIKIE